jgi:hypothetical protein
MPVATGSDLEPVADGNVLIEFIADDGGTVDMPIIKARLRTCPVWRPSPG